MTILLIIMLAVTWWANSPAPTDGPMTTRDATFCVLFTCTMALIWCVFVGIFQGLPYAAAFLSGYAMEWALSIDNLLAISLVFAYFQLPRRYEPKILSVGIASAIVFRLLFTLAGAALFTAWERTMEVVFSLVIAYTALSIIAHEGEDRAEVVDHESKWYIRGLRRWIPVTGDASKPVFFKKTSYYPPISRWYATPLLACLVAVEATDIVFSFDSAPAVLAVQPRTPMIIYSAMLFAIMGLRSMYFLIAIAQNYLTYLPRAVAGILTFVALKMLFHALTGVDLGGFVLPVVAGLLGWAVVASLKEKGRAQEQTDA